MTGRLRVYMTLVLRDEAGKVVEVSRLYQDFDAKMILYPKKEVIEVTTDLREFDSREGYEEALEKLQGSGWSSYPAILRLFDWLAAEGVRLGDVEGIRRRLIDSPGLVDALPVAVHVARRHVPEAELVLDMSYDPESEDLDMLILYVRAPSYDDDVLDRIHAAMSDFNAQAEYPGVDFLITTDFRKKGEKEE